MEFRTKINISKSPFVISHSNKLLLTGSCFTENIGNYLKQYRFAVNINPFGIMYNPISIFNTLNNIINQKIYTEQDLLQNNGLYISLDHHGLFSGTDKDEVLAGINKSIEKAHTDFNDGKYIIITLGTSFIYNYLSQNKIVANCHKIPNKEFEKRLLTTEEIKKSYAEIKDKVKDKIILFTVSPVRHWRNGAVENQRSKSILIESIHQLISENSNCHYFSAYEIMMDELRDYRFYEEDMLHPNKVAVKYIWERFAETYFNDDTSSINKKIEKINLLLQHRNKHPNTKEQILFEEKVKNTIFEFKYDFPHITMEL